MGNKILAKNVKFRNLIFSYDAPSGLFVYRAIAYSLDQILNQIGWTAILIDGQHETVGSPKLIERKLRDLTSQ